MSELAIDVKGLVKRFDNKQALAGLSLQIESGGIHAFIGSNGAGKSTLFRILLGFLQADEGESLVLGESSLNFKPQTRGRIGYVNEEHTLPDWLQTNDLLRIQKKFYPQWNEEVYQQIIANFDVDPKQKVGSLSRGERAGLNLALALAQSPELLILDEPTLGLDVVAKQEFLESIIYCCELDMTVVYCSHQMDEVERLAEDLIIIEQGRISVRSSPEEFRGRVSSWLVNAEHKRLVEEKIERFLFGRRIEDKYQFYVLDKPREFEKSLSLLGIEQAVCSDIGLASAVRAYLTANHLGSSSQVSP